MTNPSESLCLAVVSTSMVLLGGCGGTVQERFSEESPLAEEIYSPPKCSTSPEPDRLSGLNLNRSWDYIELRETSWHGREGQAGQRLGTACATAHDKSACEAALASATSSEGFRLGNCANWCFDYYLVMTSGDNVTVANTQDQLRELLGPIDTPADAIMAALTADYSVNCTGDYWGGTVPTESGFHVQATRYTSDCNPIEVTRYRLNVTKDGTVTVLDSEVIEKIPNACI